MNETTPSATQRRRMALTPDHSAGENVIVSFPSTNKVNHKKRKSVDSQSFNEFESSKRHRVSSTSKASRESRKGKAPCSSDKITSFEQDFCRFKRRCVDSSFDGSLCDIMIIYTDDSLSINKYCASTSIDTLSTASEDTFLTDSSDDFPMLSCIDTDSVLL